MEGLRFNLLIELARMLRRNISAIVERIFCGEFFVLIHLIHMDI